jgi:ArsR family transcriptional regulator
LAHSPLDAAARQTTASGHTASIRRIVDCHEFVIALTQNSLSPDISICRYMDSAASISTAPLDPAPEAPGPAEARAQAALAALGQQTRLAIFRLLMRHEPCGITVGELALAIGCPQNTASGHLAILARAQLASSARQGRSVVYRADLAGMRWLIDYLLADCCNGNASLCAAFFPAPGRECSHPPSDLKPR